MSTSYREIVKGIASGLSDGHPGAGGTKDASADPHGHVPDSTPQGAQGLPDEKSMNTHAVTGEFVDIDGERYYVIRNVDKMPPFFISVVSDSDHWMFISSNGGLTAGRVSPDTSLFPYVTVDKIHDSAVHTGCKTILQVHQEGRHFEWEPFNMEHDGLYSVSRHLYKNLQGDKLCFEEINHDLELTFRYTWATSDEFGFIRQCELKNIGTTEAAVDMVDGLQNILPADTPRFAQTNSSNLVDAYKWSELDEKSGIAMYTLYSGITDRAEPCESLRANTVFCLGLQGHKVLISSEQLDHFRLGHELEQEHHKRGIRGSYLVNSRFDLTSMSSHRWQFVANIQQSQSQVVQLRNRLSAEQPIDSDIEKSIEQGTDRLSRILGRGDGYQLVSEETESVHHYANVLFNVLRGGIFDDQYRISAKDFASNIENFNRHLYQRHSDMLAGLPDKIDYRELLILVREQSDPQLERLCMEYLPITFGRRHGDPSRPWNQFAINLKDDDGKPLLSYEGNWRDIFQNWEALTLSYPEFAENVIAKFVNASTIDGYNPYRITKQGIDWEVEDLDDPWSYIGYWGDHQIIYLLKLLELSSNFHPDRLSDLLFRQVYSYANVPYRIKTFSQLLNDAKSTVEYDDELAQQIDQRVADTGADGKLVLDQDGLVYQVNLLEKLLVPLLSKLGNLVVDGGIWLNTQRPEWNDANNALVGQGLSMVTLYYLRRYISFMVGLISDQSGEATISSEVCEWLNDTSDALKKVRGYAGQHPLTAGQKFDALTMLGEAAARYRDTLYRIGTFSGRREYPIDTIRSMLDDALAVIDHSIGANQRDDGLYHAYNLVDIQGESIEIDELYPMLEGQVAVLSSGAVPVSDIASVVESLFDSDIYRTDQQTFMLYPDRALPGFFDKNLVPEDRLMSIPLIGRMLELDDHDLISRDDDGQYRFDAELTNAGALSHRLELLRENYGELVDGSSDALLDLYEDVFNHQEFTGRSGGMFGFEGLGCIYWHMVSKLLLAVQENFFWALDEQVPEEISDRLGELYYRIRDGLGFNKSPSEYGAFPTDPYSHTPGHAGAQQPGMTGQVKEEIITRFRELGIHVRDGAVHFRTDLLRQAEFLTADRELRYLDVDDKWQTLKLPAHALAFSWCQVPVIYQLVDDEETCVVVTRADGSEVAFASPELPLAESKEIFRRSGQIRRIELKLSTGQLFGC